MKTRHLVVPAILVLLLLVACSGEEIASAPEQPTSSQASSSEPVASENEDEAEVAASEGIVATRPPLPTNAPDFIAREVTEFVRSSDLRGSSFLGLTAENWINLAISLLIIGLAYIIGTLLTRALIRWVARRSSPELGQILQESIGPRLRWLVVIQAFYIATVRLDFLSTGLKMLLAEVYFVMALSLVTLIVWTLIDLRIEYYRQKFVAEEREDQLLQSCYYSRVSCEWSSSLSRSLFYCLTLVSI